MEILHTINVMLSLYMEVGQGAGSYLLFSLPWVQILSCPEVQTFSGISQNLWFLGSV